MIIKRYGNRRLYDTTNSRYINQDEVGLMVRAGRDIQVVDAATGEDLTRLVLTQIIVQDAKESDSAFPLDLLRQMVVACGKATEGTTLKYMKAVADLYQNAYQAVTPQMNPFRFMGVPTEPLSVVSKIPLSPRVPEEPTAQGVNEDKGDIKKLNQRLQELESLVADLGNGNTARSRKKGQPKRN